MSVASCGDGWVSAPYVVVVSCWSPQSALILVPTVYLVYLVVTVDSRGFHFDDLVLVVEEFLDERWL